MSHCTVTTPPRIEDGKVVFSVVHDESGQAFRCELTDFTDVMVVPIPRDATPWPEGDARRDVAEAAIAHCQSQQDEFVELFARAARARAETD